jgi:hypothetical protein
MQRHRNVISKELRKEDMAKVRYCVSCEKNVSAEKKFSLPIFLLFCLTGIGGIIYLIWYIVKPRNRCPICRTPGLMPAKSAQELRDLRA